MREDNRVTLGGRIVDEPIFSHHAWDEDFYSFTLCATRLSGVEDLLPIVAPAAQAQRLHRDQRVSLNGEVRSFCKNEDGHNRLILSIFTRRIEQGGESRNYVALSGALVKDPVYRLTPFGRQIADILLCVPRTGWRTDLVPCILWGRQAVQLNALKKGDVIRLEGRMQSRAYEKVTPSGTERRIAFEISGGRFMLVRNA